LAQAEDKRRKEVYKSIIDNFYILAVGSFDKLYKYRYSQGL
jgi:hypothetical protein|tara:strand:+ start:739 stop:861 length:123 start_codon:yes stop_codon:yes gene_type:complete